MSHISIGWQSGYVFSMCYFHLFLIRYTVAAESTSSLSAHIEGEGFIFIGYSCTVHPLLHHVFLEMCLELDLSPRVAK